MKAYADLGDEDEGQEKVDPLIVEDFRADYSSVRAFVTAGIHEVGIPDKDEKTKTKQNEFTCIREDNVF
jgi:hypothetical protein